MSGESRLDELMVRWRELRRAGRPASAESLCAERPDLLDALRRRIAAEPPDTLQMPDDSGADGPRPEDDDPRIGTTLGRYLITGVLGEGGMGRVYEGYEPLIGRHAAIKLLGAGAEGDENETLEKFVLEARAAAKLEHPNVVGVYEVDREQGVTYIAMQLVRGGSAADLIEDGRPVPWRRATRIIADAARGLAAAHSGGIIHRDIKPANILLTEDGQGKLADFGLARPIGPGKTITPGGLVLGTPAFMSPEQCRGLAMDGRSDLYSLAATWYALLAGAPPFAGSQSTELIMLAHCNEEIPDPRKVVPDLPDAVVGVLMRGMAKEASERPQDAHSMLADLEALLELPRSEVSAVRTLPAPPPSAERRDAPLSRLRRSLATMAHERAEPEPTGVPLKVAVPAAAGIFAAGLLLGWLLAVLTRG